MIKKKKGSYLKTFLLLLVIVINNCNDNPTKPNDPPTIYDPANFRITDFEPAWSPDGLSIAYVHGDTIEGKTGIYLYNFNSKVSRQVIYSAKAYSPAWSPDSKWIVFSMNAQIWKIKVNGDSLTQLTSEGRNFYPSVSPCGKWIAFDSNNDSPNGMNFLWKMNINGNDKTRISYTPEYGEIRMSNWGEKNKILHIRYSTEFNSYNPEVCIVDSNGGSYTRITNTDTFNSYPKYCRTTNRVMYTSQDDGKYPQIWICNEDGTNAKQLTETQGYTSDWSPNGERIVYTDSRADNGSLWMMDADGRNKEQLTFNK